MPVKFKNPEFKEIEIEINREFERINRGPKIKKIGSATATDDLIDGELGYYVNRQGQRIVVLRDAGRLFPLTASKDVVTYTVTNGTIDRTFDANASNNAEAMDVLYTLLNDLMEGKQINVE